MSAISPSHTVAYDGFGGLVVSMLASGTRVRGFKPGRSRWIFRASEKSSACLSSEGKWKNLSHVPALRHVKEPSTSVNYECASKIPCMAFKPQTPAKYPKENIQQIYIIYRIKKFTSLAYEYFVIRRLLSTSYIIYVQKRTIVNNATKEQSCPIWPLFLTFPEGNEEQDEESNWVCKYRDSKLPVSGMRTTSVSNSRVTFSLFIRCVSAGLIPVHQALSHWVMVPTIETTRSRPPPSPNPQTKRSHILYSWSVSWISTWRWPTYRGRNMLLYSYCTTK